MAVILILAILAGVALPRFFDNVEEAKRRKAESVIGSVRTGLAMTHMAYLSGVSDSLPPDANGDNFPDHLGDTAAGEKTLFDAILAVPILTDPTGWKQYTPFQSGPWVSYFHDSNGNAAFEPATEAIVSYNTTNGDLAVTIPW